MNYIKEHWDYLVTPGCYPGIDLLRAIAVSLVLLFHFRMLRIGWIGVDLFFVISGFLIGGMIVEKLITGMFSVKNFYLRRSLRILPTYYFLIFLCCISQFNNPIDIIAVKSILSGIVFLQTVGPYFYPEFFVLNTSYVVGGSWSLVVEEIFYLVTPLFLFLFVKITRRNLKLLAIVIGIIVLIAIFVRIKMISGFAPDDPNWHWASFVQFHSRFDELTIGMLAAVLIRIAPNIKNNSPWWIVGGSTLAWLFLAYIYGKPDFLVKPYTITRDTIWLPTLLGCAGFSFLLGMYWWNVKFAPVIMLARISYPLYLIHIYVGNIAEKYSKNYIIDSISAIFSINGKNVILILFSIVAAYAISLCLEYPFIRLYKKNN